MQAQVLGSVNGKIVDEFQYLLEKSQQLFSGLRYSYWKDIRDFMPLNRDLPPHGSQKTWQPYFQKTFEIYTKVYFIIVGYFGLSE
jgi:hypothetical protein